MNNLTLTLVQSNLQCQQAEENREILTDLLAESASETDLVILPEIFTSAFSMDSGAIAEDWSGRTLDWMQEISELYNAAVWQFYS